MAKIDGSIKRIKRVKIDGEELDVELSLRDIILLDRLEELAFRLRVKKNG